MSQTSATNFDSSALAGLRGISALHIVVSYFIHLLTVSSNSMSMHRWVLSILCHFMPSITVHLISTFMDRFTCLYFSSYLDFAWPLDMVRPNMMGIKCALDPVLKSVMDMVVVKLETTVKKKSSIHIIFWLADVPESYPSIGWLTSLEYH